MTTRASIIQLGDQLTRDKGYNAFSFYDISRKLGIRNASIHYHFPTKSDLAIAIIRTHQQGLATLQQSVEGKDPLRKLKSFLSVYDTAHAENRVCIVGSLATDLHTVELPVKQQLELLVADILNWLAQILEEGRDEGCFFFEGSSRKKALLVITNMLGALQISRITEAGDYERIKKEVVKDLTRNHQQKKLT